MRAKQGGGASQIERWIGRNVIGVIASVMVFIGLLSLGLLVIPSLGDTAKIALTFVFSWALTSIGIIMSIRKHDNFATTLLGCGCGSLFISIMLAHTLFHALTDIVVFALLLLWLGGTLFLVKATGSLTLSIIAHAGMVVSLCVAYATGTGGERLMLTLVYHALTVGVILAGDVICSKKAPWERRPLRHAPSSGQPDAPSDDQPFAPPPVSAAMSPQAVPSYAQTGLRLAGPQSDTPTAGRHFLKLGLFVSLFLSLVAVSAMNGYYSSVLAQADAMQLGCAIAAFGIQLAGAFVLSVAIARSSALLKSGAGRIVLLNAALLLSVIIVAAYLFPLTLSSLLFYQEAPWLLSLYPIMAVSTLTAAAVLLAHLFFIVTMRKRLRLDRAYELITVIASSGTIAVLFLGLYGMAVYWGTGWLSMPALIIVTLALAGFLLLTKDRVYLWLSLGVLMADFALMVLGGYHAITFGRSVVLGFIYLGLALALLFFLWSRLGEGEKAALLVPFRILVLAVFEASTIVILSASRLPRATSISLLLITVAFLVLFGVKFDNRSARQKGFWLFMRIHELFLMVAGSWFIAFGRGPWHPQWVYIALAVASLALLVCTVYSVARAPRKYRWLGVFAGMCLTLVAVASITGMTSWFDEPYVLSLVLMLCALACIVGGFVTRIKPLRLYGLILILCCILKLVILDMGNADTIMRVVAFISGGLICFGISALYNYAIKRLDGGPDRKAAGPGSQ